MQEIMQNVYQCDIPLKGSPLREIHNFLIRGEDRSLLIDTAFNTDECEQALKSQLDELHVDMDQTDIFLTHLHVDHVGLISRLKTPNNRIFASALDKAHIDNYQNPDNWPWLDANNVWAGVPAEHALTPEQHVAYFFRPSKIVPIEAVSVGGTMDYGGYHMEIVDLAGHTRGQIGLWHEPSRSLFCGDHVLGKISPNISAWDLEYDYIKMYLDHLRYAKSLQPKRLMACHGTEIANPEQRIDDLLAHHANRLTLMENIVREAGEPVTAFYVAAKMQWSKNKDFFGLPIQQKWFATTETLAHLVSLTRANRLASAQETPEATVYFSA